MYNRISIHNLAYADSGQVKRLMTLKNYFRIKNYNGL